MKRKEPTRRISNAGRPKGRCGPSRKTKTALAKRVEAAWEGKTPLDFLLAVMNDKKAKKGHRIDAAGKAMPYMHKRKPVAVELDDRREMTAEEIKAETSRVLSDIRSLGGAAAAEVAGDDDADNT